MDIQFRYICSDLETVKEINAAQELDGKSLASIKYEPKVYNDRDRILFIKSVYILTFEPTNTITDKTLANARIQLRHLYKEHSFYHEAPKQNSSGLRNRIKAQS